MWKKLKYGLLSLIIILFFIGVLIPIDKTPVLYYKRHSSVLDTEKIAGEFWLRWLYNNPTGEITLEALIKRKIISDWYGKQMDDPSSSKKIKPFIKEYGINMIEVEDTNFKTFNDFFIRKLKSHVRPIDTSFQTIISPADGKVFAYSNISESDFIVKGVRFNIYDFLRDTALARKFKNASMYIVRLCPSDYHRFHFPLNAKVLLERKIDGAYYSVSPIALREKIMLFVENKREFTVLQNDLVGEFIMAEVGATLVGSIIQTFKNNIVKKGEEKGFFKFGGSTVILLFREGTIIIDEDLVKNTKQGYETEVKMGERIGTIKNQILPKN